MKGLLFLALLAMLSLDFTCPNAAAQVWGRLANPGFDGQRIKTTMFFAGQARDSSTPYGCYQSPNIDTYTLNPVPRDSHLNWTNPVNRDFILNLMVQTEINVVTMSSWGEDFQGCSNSWVTGEAPMQTSPEAHTNLFEGAVGKPLLIMPLIETRFNNWAMRDEFPRWTNGVVAPGLVSQVVNLVNRYLRNTDHPEWAKKWARVYDRSGTPRYAVVLIHVASNRLNADDHAGFAAGFSLVAADVAARTGGVQVGFFIDPLPPEGFAAAFKPTANGTGPYLTNTASFLGIQCFVPEVFAGPISDAERLAWKRNLLRDWFSTGIPLLVDVTPGYDAHIIFGPNAPRFGHTEEWLQGMTSLVNDYGQAGIVYNSWNGFTEGMAATPVAEIYGNRFFDWLRTLSPERRVYVDRNYAGPELGTAIQPFDTVTEANQIGRDGDRFRIRTGIYQEALTFSKRLTLQAEGGPVTIGP